MLKTKILLPAVFLLAFSLFGGVGRATNNTGASLSMAGSSYAPGATFSVTIYENSADQPVNVVETDLNYDSSQLDFISIDNSASTFNGSFKADGGQGKVSIIRYVPSGDTVSGNAQVSIVTFKALAGTNASTIGFSSSSSIYSPGGKPIWDGQNNSATFSFTTPPPPPAPTPAVPTPVTPVKNTPPVKKTSPVSVKNQHSIEGLSLAKTLNDFPNSQTTPASNPITGLLIACGLAAATCVALYFNAHQKIARHAVRISKKSAQRLNQKRMVIQAKRSTRRLPQH